LYGPAGLGWLNKSETETQPQRKLDQMMSHAFCFILIGVCAMIATMAQPQLPGQANQIAQQCKPYTGSICSGIVDYDYLDAKGNGGSDFETTVKEALKKVEVNTE